MIFFAALAIAVLAAARGTWSPCGLSMLSSLNPVAESARGYRFWITGIWYLLGCVAGGALLGVGVGVAAVLFGRAGAPETVTWALVLAAALVAVASDTRLFGRALPDHPRQVDVRWLARYRRWVYASGFGVQIGTGFATYIMTAAVYLTGALAVLTESWWQGLTVALVFGTARGLSIILAAVARTPERLRAIHARLARLDAVSLQVCVAGCGCVAVLAGAQLAGAAGAVAVALFATAAGVRTMRFAGRAVVSRGR